MAVKVIKPGLSTTVQDLGRPGYYHIGIPISGAMDRLAAKAANWLGGNSQGAAVLEAVFMGPELQFTEDATVAVTGAELPPKVDGETRQTWTSFKVKKGQTLAFDFLKKGARAYIAISGGVDVPVVVGGIIPDADVEQLKAAGVAAVYTCLLYTSPSPRDRTRSRMPSSA